MRLWGLEEQNLDHIYLFAYFNRLKGWIKRPLKSSTAKVMIGAKVWSSSSKDLTGKSNQITLDDLFFVSPANGIMLRPWRALNKSFSEEVGLVAQVSAFHIRVSGCKFSSPSPDPSFPPRQILGGCSGASDQLGPCHPCGSRLGLSAWHLALSWPSPGQCEHLGEWSSKWELSIPFSLSPSLLLSHSDWQVSGPEHLGNVSFLRIYRSWWPATQATWLSRHAGF